MYEVLICRGILFILKSAFQDAAAILESAVKLKPNEWQALFWLGIAYGYLGQDEEAIELIKKALKQGLPKIFLAPVIKLEKDRHIKYNLA